MAPAHHNKLNNKNLGPLPYIEIYRIVKKFIGYQIIKVNNIIYISLGKIRKIF